MMSFNDLPAELMLHVMSFLDFRSIIQCSAVCRSINHLAKDELYWRLQCKVVWKQETCPSDLTWRDYFIQFHNDFGSYLDIYGAVLKAWNQIKSYIKADCPKIFNSLNAGVSEKDLDGFEKKIGWKLPRDLRCIYRIHNGQRKDCEEFPVAGLFGTIHNYDYFRNERMVQIQDMLDPRTESERQLGILRISEIDHSGVSQFLCLTDRHGFEIGTIYCQSGDAANAGLAEGNCFISARSYLDWFTQYAKELANKTFPLVTLNSQHYIYRFYQEPGCVAITDHVRVSVATAFIPEMSSAKSPHFTFAYRISMSMDADVAPRHSCQLETRHWVITDERGKTSRVDGPGVIGEFPLIRPGSVYSYVSCTNFKTRHGEMKGTYTFRILATSERLEVVVPLFHMTCPEYLTLEDRKAKISTRRE